MGTPPKGFLYIPGFLTPAEQQALLGRLSGLDYEHDVFRGRRLKRAYAQFGYAYVSTGRRIAPAPPIPAFLTALMEKGLPHCPEGTSFNQCIVTRYPEGTGIGWHTDAARFGECILAVSLGVEARLQFRPGGSKGVSHEVGVAPGSLYVMSRAARWDYQHQVIPVKSVRFSLIFRHVTGPQGDQA